MFPFQQFHDDFQELIETWLENTFEMRFPVKKIIFVSLLEIVVNTKLDFSFDYLVFIHFMLLTPIVYMTARIKQMDWLH